MKNVYLLSGMIALCSIVGLSAMEKERPSIYQIIDPLVRKYKTYDKYGQRTYHDTSDWPAIFKMLDEFNGAINVNEYFFQIGDGFSPLLDIAVGESNLLVVKELLEKYHANPNAELVKKYYPNQNMVKSGWTALTSACSKLDVPMVKLLLMHGANPNIKWTYDNKNIIEMVEEKKKETLKTKNIKESEKAPILKKIDEILRLLNDFKSKFA